MYEVFYNLKAEPFRLSPDHKFCFEHKSYAKARAYIAYAFKRAEGFVMITGRPGTGKTTLIGELVESFAKDRVFTANLVCTQMDADDLLKTVAYSFGIGSAKLDKAELLQRLTILFHRWHREGRRALLIVDEAQDLSSSAMEELRLLTNIQISGQPLLQIFLLGQPELKDLILSPPMEQVHQRIVAATHIDGLEADETEAYVIHRLLAVGWHGNPAIDRAIFPVIHRFSEGVPRRINLICSRLILLGSVEQRHAIELEDVRVVISELQAENLAAGTGFSREDFLDSGQTEWVQVASPESPGRPEPHLVAVNGESYTTATQARVEDENEAKKKDITEVTPSFHHVSASDLFDSHRSNVDERRPADDQGRESFRESESISGFLEADANLQWIEPEDGEGLFATETDDAVKSPSRWRHSIAMVTVAIAAIVMTLFLWAYLSHRESRSNPQNRESRAQSANDHSATSEKELVTSGSLVSTPLTEQVVTPLPDVPEVTEIMAPPSPQDAAIDDDFAGQPRLNTRPVSTLEFASAERSPVQDDKSPRDAIAKPENSEEKILKRFASDSDDILPDSHQALHSALERFRDQPDSLASIAGFSDSRGDTDYNLQLSRKRADVDEQLPETEAGMEPYRIVQMTFSRDRSQ